METWIALIRGINVGGKNKLKMADLKSDLEALKLKNVRTYIQSGNIVFDSTEKSAPALAKKIAVQIEQRHGIRPHLFILSRADLISAVESNPFPKAVTDPKTLQFFFLAEPASAANMEALDNAKASTEKYRLTERILYLHAPDGVGRSKHPRTSYLANQLTPANGKAANYAHKLMRGCLSVASNGLVCD